MERDGLVVRAPDPDDRRAQRVRLTGRGRELRKVARKVLAALDRRVSQRLSEREIATFESCLQEVMSL
jgi:DNA-binding MarR family transcriptional regulator